MSDISQHLADLRSHRGPVVAGPWMSEIGFELLYWIPFLRWCMQEKYLTPERTTILSRGGCRSWYAGLGRYVELFDHYTPDQFRLLNERRVQEQAPSVTKKYGMRIGQHTSKHLVSGRVDAEILERVQLSHDKACPPFLMYRMFQDFWGKRMPDLHRNRTKVKRLTAPPKPAGLPDHYVAVKFYASQACQTNPIHRLLVNQIVRAIAQQIDVVLLHTGTRFDDHGEFAIEPHPHVHHVVFTPATNLDEQSAILGGASAFIGTYGGFAYLAPFLGIPALALYGAANFRQDHYALMKTVAVTRLRTPFQVLELQRGASAVGGLLKGIRHAAA